jgi:hypothetical protein
LTPAWCWLYLAAPLERRNIVHRWRSPGADMSSCGDGHRKREEKMRTVVNQKATLPPGKFRVRLKQIEDGTGKFGPILKWTFTVTQGELKDRTISHTTGVNAGDAKSKLNRLLVGMLGRKLRDKEVVFLDLLEGMHFGVVLELNDNEYSEIVRIRPAEEGQYDAVAKEYNGTEEQDDSGEAED